ncbi:hypothetical protein [Mycobacterium stomatepiae]|uniref:Pilin n=1 Tax=Mycobacterium stomatepiae TaxID=470076 RepID=A0A7I7QFA9_9MYCO|nr:hypothetical protein [Mycobacterium stomatepiae]MCV7164787.1 hypothetical protein [Mycobacterium stomatepiae]BBY24949.1 hypothetical protein MSTO_51540 [Mycobacterium stomatepiae]
MATAKHTRAWVRLLAGGGLAMTALGLVGAVAQAAPAPAPTNHWCPGQQWDPAWGTNYHWDWSQCHDWQGPAPAGWGPWGPPPPWAPQAHLMWNPTTGVWGFFNNGIWTPV